jgi:hypothetical protein
LVSGVSQDRQRNKERGPSSLNSGRRNTKLVLFVLSRSAKRTEPKMRTNINRKTSSDLLGNRQGRIVVAANDRVRSVAVVLPISGQLFTALVGYQGALKRAMKPAATGAAAGMETAITSLVSITRGLLSRCWHTPSVMPHHAVVRVSS